MKYSTYLKEVRSIVITETMLHDNHAFICNRTYEAVDNLTARYGKSQRSQYCELANMLQEKLQQLIADAGTNVPFLICVDNVYYSWTDKYDTTPNERSEMRRAMVQAARLGFINQMIVEAKQGE